MKLQVVMLDRLKTFIAVNYENQGVPHGKRLVSIELTEEQKEALRPQHLGEAQGDEWYEEIGEVWLEPPYEEVEGGSQEEAGTVSVLPEVGQGDDLQAGGQDEGGPGGDD